MKIGIIGLGLIGSSMARALKKNVDEITIYGDDKQKSYLKFCLEHNIIDNTLNNSIVNKLDILFIAVPVRAFISVIDKIISNIDANKTVITDMGSTKLKITAYMKNNFPDHRFIGGHPMAGKEKSGPAAGDPVLFKNKNYILIKENEDNLKWQNVIINIIKKIGANILFFDAEEHDKLVSFTSHLPQFLATGFINEFINFEKNNNKTSSLIGQGFKDFSRIAGSDPDMWVDIFLSNKKYIVENIDSTLKQYQLFLEALKNEDEAEIKKFLIKGRKKRKKL